MANISVPRKLEDDASANLDPGVPVLAVQKATPANTAGTDGDYEFLQMSAGRVWCSAVITALPAPFGAAGAASIAKSEDAASANADVGVPPLFVQRGTPANQADATGDYELFQGNKGRLHTGRPNEVGTATTITALDAVVGAPGGAGTTVSGASTAGSLVSLALVGGESTVDVFTVAGSYTGKIYFEGSVNSGDGTSGSWVSLVGTRLGDNTNTQVTGHSAAGAAVNNVYRVNVAGFTYFRVRLVGAVFTSAPTITLVASGGVGMLRIDGPVYASPVDPLCTYKGRVATFLTPGRAGTAGQKIFAIHNATGSTKVVRVRRLVVDKFETVVKAVTVAPPIVRAHRFTAVPTNGTALTKVAKDTALTANASVTVWGDASADATGSGTTLTITIPANSCIAQEAASRLLTAAGYEATDAVVLLENEDIILRPLEGVVVFLAYTLATQNPVTDMWTAHCDFEERDAA